MVVGAGVSAVPKAGSSLGIQVRAAVTALSLNSTE